MGRVRLRGHIAVPAERLVEVETALVDHIRLTRAEPGCLEFTVEKVAGQEGRFAVAELFVDEPAFRAHQRRGAASAWGEVTAGIPRHYEITTEDEAGRWVPLS